MVPTCVAVTGVVVVVPSCVAVTDGVVVVPTCLAVVVVWWWCPRVWQWKAVAVVPMCVAVEGGGSDAHVWQ